MSNCEWVHHASPGTKAGELERRKQGLTTHLSVWPAAQCFAKWLEQNSSAIGLNAAGAKVLELGSGTGFLGCTLARNLPAAKLVQLTDLADAVDDLKQYCNEFSKQHNVNNLHVCACNWEEYGAPDTQIRPCQDSGVDRADGWDFILGSDLVWNHTNIKLLPPAVKAALRGGNAGCTAYYAHWQRNPWALPLLLEGFDAAGLQTEYLNPYAVEAAVETDPEAALLPQETDEGYDWNNVIFNETKEEPPIFCIYKIWLRQAETMQA